MEFKDWSLLQPQASVAEVPNALGIINIKTVLLVET